MVYALTNRYCYGGGEENLQRQVNCVSMHVHTPYYIGISPVHAALIYLRFFKIFIETFCLNKTKVL